MKRLVCFFILFLWTASLLRAVGSPQQPAHKTWYEHALRQINPHDTDYGAIYEQRKREFMNRMGSPAFQYGLWATGATVWLLVVLFVQHVSHRRAQGVAVQSIADVVRHDAIARETAREAIRRYNDHIESCNRVIESAETGSSKWVSSAEWEALQADAEKYRGEAVALREETRRLRGEGERRRTTDAETTAQPSPDFPASLPFSKDTTVAQYVTVINGLQDELLAERKKNQRLKSTKG